MALIALGAAWVGQKLVGSSPLWAIGIIAILLAPGAISRLVLKDLFASRALMSSEDFEGALSAAQRFLSASEKRPWIRRAIWTQFGAYSLDARAMAHNNAGAALIELGRLEEAERELQAARVIDPKYPKPVFNQAVIAAVLEKAMESERLARQAAELGYEGGQLDRIHDAIIERYARFAVGRDRKHNGAQPDS